MLNLFERANNIGLDHIRDWLPNGRQEGDEWSALNPTRDDKKLGSFKINLKTGVWMDGATEDAGPDVVSLYCYLNANKCAEAASKKGYKNIEGGSQAEAARFILEAYDNSYFPSDTDNFTPPKNVGPSGRWDGFRWAGIFKEKLPEINLSWYEKKWGENIASWDFTTEKGSFILRVVRFIDGDSKSDRPFTLWKKGTDIQWRAIRPQVDSLPLWNLQKIQSADYINLPVVICEGQKSASRGDASDIKGFVFTGWYGGAGNSKGTDWSPLRGRTCFFWPDGDAPGRNAIKSLRELAVKYDFTLKVIHPPVGVPKGWDIADAINEGRDIKEIIEGADKEGVDAPRYLDDYPLPFSILGTSGSDIVFYPFGSNRIETFKSSSLTKTALLTLADRTVWGTYYKKEGGGISWDAAVNDVIRKSEKVPVFDWRRVRGVGAWYDDGDIVINTGEYLLINGEKKELYSRVKNYVYEKSFYTPYTLNSPLDTQSSTRLLDCLRHISWKKKGSPYALAGWIALSPWGGLLQWRPHIWLVGPKGTGKTWVVNKIIMPVAIKKFGVRGDGKSTTAGIRQNLRNSSKSFLGDEMESETKTLVEKIDEIVSLFRGASSGQDLGGVILHGSLDGQGKQWVMQSMACFASIGSGMIHGADMDRFTVCEMAPARSDQYEKRKEDFVILEKLVKGLTGEWISGFHSRMYHLLPELLETIDIMKAQVGEKMKSMRDGDQLGTLIAGSWMINHDKPPLASEAANFLDEINIADMKSDDSAKTDEEKCFDTILSAKVEVSTNLTRQKISVGTACDLYYDSILKKENAFDSEEKVVYGGVYSTFTRDAILHACEMVGVLPKVVDGVCYLYVAMASVELRKVLNPEGFSSSYVNILERLEDCKGIGGPIKINGVRKRYVKMLMRKEGEMR